MTTGWGDRGWWLELTNGFWFFRHHERLGIYWLIEGTLTSRKGLGSVELLSTLLGWLFLYSVLSLQLYRIQNWVARKIPGQNRNEVTGNWRKLHSKELLKLYILPNIIGIVRSMRIKLAGVVARMGTRRSSYRFLVREPQAMTTLWKPMRKWGILLKWV